MTLFRALCFTAAVLVFLFAALTRSHPNLKGEWYLLAIGSALAVLPFAVEAWDAVG